jgi:hypothetical protein
MKVYSVSPVDSVDGQVCYFTNKRDAIQCAREVASDGSQATVEARTIRAGRGRDLFVDLLNRVRWCADSEVVKVFPAKKVTL